MYRMIRSTSSRCICVITFTYSPHTGKKSLTGGDKDLWNPVPLWENHHCMKRAPETCLHLLSQFQNAFPLVCEDGGGKCTINEHQGSISLAEDESICHSQASVSKSKSCQFHRSPSPRGTPVIPKMGLWAAKAFRMWQSQVRDMKPHMGDQMEGKRWTRRTGERKSTFHPWRGMASSVVFSSLRPHEL